MIENGFVYISFLICFVAIVFFMVDKLKWKVFDIFSPMLIIYLGSAILGSLGLFPKTESVVVYQDIVTVNFLPLMLVFMLLQCDLRKILRMGPKMLLSFMCATFTICLGFVVAFLIFKNKLGSDAWSVLGAASGAWIGGSSNMMATANALGVSEEGLSYAILMGSISYTVLLSILMMTLQFVKKFNKWTNANTTYLDETTASLQRSSEEKVESKPPTFIDIMILLAIGFGVSSIAQVLAENLPQVGNVLNSMTWTILIVSTVSIILGMTPISKINGSPLIGNVFMYLLLAVTGSKASFFGLSDAPIYIIFGFIVIAVHIIGLLLLAKLFRLDLFACELGSIANVGGVTSAPIFAGVYNPTLIPVGVLMGLLGNVIGTYVALSLSQVLLMLS
ncbi:DUF819 family protein [Paraclostridium sordellii]|uniref:DUF819 family protein n=1 Tax=Paraclostridium sordellii TaxID=1505 RepID=UPI0005E0CAE7|nr:DUF819 family protein [Paeniclostridium sordellii]CEP39037.1 membrane protein [[Clostridium] sordellii] [Paeniclostridium sordellii]